MKQAYLGLNLPTKRTRKREFLAQAERVVPWAALVDLLAPHAPKGKRSRPPFPIETMLRVHFMQQWFTLSDPAMEEALHDMPLFREFAGLGWDTRLPDERHVYAERADMLALARAADRRDVRAMIRLAFYTGMRLGELARVEVAGDTLLLADTKNGDRRAVPLHPRARVLLRYLPLAAPKITLQRAFQRARVRAGLPHIHIHDLRHSAASEMVNAGLDLYTVGQVLGHRDARSTKRYAHLTAGTLADAVGKIGRQKVPHKAGGNGAGNGGSGERGGMAA